MNNSNLIPLATMIACTIYQFYLIYGLLQAKKKINKAFKEAEQILNDTVKFHAKFIGIRVIKSD